MALVYDIGFQDGQQQYAVMFRVSWMRGIYDVRILQSYKPSSCILVETIIKASATRPIHERIVFRWQQFLRKRLHAHEKFADQPNNSGG